MKKITLALITASLFLNSCSKECTCEQTEEKTLNTQPGPDNGQDAFVIYRETDNNLYATSNFNIHPDLIAVRWTWSGEGAGQGSSRVYIKFPAVSEIPSKAVIKSAKLSLFGLTSSASTPQGNSYYPGSGYASYGTNDSWLKRVLGNWEEASINWNTKPATSDVNQVTIGASTTQWGYHVENIDVTEMVKEMVSKGENYGFCMQLKTEAIYRSLVFGSSETSDPTRRPKLVVEYEVTN